MVTNATVHGVEAPVRRLAYSPTEAAAALGLNRATIFRMLTRGELASVRAGKRRLIPAHVLEAFLRRTEVENGSE